ncbi:MAG: SBBP repeat-containing protein [Ignavibacteriae bacterium]|nr:SBBP repeat-containing protein [Ignavibacteriota bacterium]MCB9217693.1 SBBP repeat-containing protein [Ignavibacteria bacterium]
MIQSFYLFPSAGFILYVILLLFPQNVAAQQVDWFRASTGPNPSSEKVWDVAIDEVGNIYVVGSVAGTATFGDTTIQTTQSGVDEPLIVSYSPTGEVRWVRVMKGVRSNPANQVVVPAGDGVYVTGNFYKEVRVGDGVRDTVLTSDPPNAGQFVVKFERSGDFAWVINMGAKHLYSTWLTLAPVRSAPGVLLVANYYGADTIAGVPIVADSVGTFFLRLDPSGSVRWVKKEAESHGHSVHDITVDKDGNITLLGLAFHSIQFGDETTASPAERGEWFVASFTSEGEFRWYTYNERFSGEYPFAIDADAAGDLYIVGHFTKELVVIGGDTISRGGYDGSFLVRYSKEGSLRWGRKVSGRVDDSLGTTDCRSLAVDRLGNSYITGSYSYLADIDSTTIYPPVGSRTRNDSIGRVVAKFNPDGVLDWVITNHSGSGSLLLGGGMSIALDPDRFPVIAGNFSLSVQFGDSTHVTNDNEYIGLIKLSQTKPGTPRIVTPGNGGAFLLTNTPFAWRPAFEAKRYQIQFALDTIFTRMVLDSILTETSTYFPGMEYGRRYHWRVRGINGSDTGAWTPRRTFTSRTDIAVSDHRWFVTERMRPISITTDADGNSAVIGTSLATLEIGGATIPNLYTFIAQYDSDGNPIWSRPIAPSLDVSGVDRDDAGNFYLEFTYSGRVELEDTALVSTPRRSSMGVIKLSPRGQLLWARSSSSTDLPSPGSFGSRGLAAFPNGGCVAVCFVANHQISFDGVSLPPIYGSGIILVRYSSDGAVEYAKATESNGKNATLYSYDLATDRSENAYIVGLHADTFQFGTLKFFKPVGPVAHNLFIAKVDSRGVTEWGKSITGGNLLSRFARLGTDSVGNLYWANSQKSTIVIEDRERGLFDTVKGSTSSIDLYIYLGRFDGAGNLDWVVPIGGRAELRDLAVTPGGISLITGEYEENVRFQSTLCESWSTRSDAMVIRVSPEGTIDWLTKAGSYRDSTAAEGIGVSYDQSGAIYWTGFYTGPMQFGPHDLRGSPMFLTKIGTELTRSYALLAPINRSTINEQSVLLRWVPVPGAISYDLEVSLAPPFQNYLKREQGLTETEYLLSGLQPGDHIYWHVRANIPGESLPWSDGWSFQVSEAVPMLTVEEEQAPLSLSEELHVTLYPNPSSESITLSYRLKEGADLSITFHDSYGRLVLSQNLNRQSGSGEIVVPISTLRSGCYLCRVASNGECWTGTVQIVR